MGVALASRNLFENRTRLVVSVAGVVLAALLILVLDGVLAGATRQVTTFMDNVPFDLVVSQRGVRNLHMTTSFFAESKLREIARIDGVRHADPVLYTTTFLTLRGQRSLAYLIGYEPGRPGGPWAWAGRQVLPTRDGIIVDARIAEDFGGRIGDPVTAGGADLRLEGLAKGTTSILNSIAFMDRDAFESAQGLQGVVSFGLITLDPGADADRVARQIRREIPGVTVLTREEFADSERRVVSDMSTELMQMMNFIGFLVGLAVVALTVYTTTLQKLSEYGILKAIGASNARLVRVVCAQSAISITLGLLGALGIALLLQGALGYFGGRVPMVVTWASVLKVTIGAAAVGSLASLLPIARIARLKPAEVFRR
ncbi:MAG: FtsX-like permease family protein [Coriobacteriales bacterium]|nr:FtsX-like permease family protein [Coriobacteriales bacterium]